MKMLRSIATTLLVPVFLALVPPAHANVGDTIGDILGVLADVGFIDENIAAASDIIICSIEKGGPEPCLKPLLDGLTGSAVDRAKAQLLQQNPQFKNVIGLVSAIRNKKWLKAAEIGGEELVCLIGGPVACTALKLAAEVYEVCVALYKGGAFVYKTAKKTVSDVLSGKTPGWVPGPIRDGLNDLRKSCDTTMPTAKYYDLYFAPVVDKVVIGMDSGVNDPWTPVVLPRWNACKSYYYTRSFTSNPVCTNGEAVAQEYCDRIRDNQFHPAVMKRYFSSQVVTRYPKLAKDTINGIQQKLPPGTPDMRIAIASAMGMFYRKDGSVDYGKAGTLAMSRAISYVKEPYFRAVAKGQHNTGITYYDFPLDVDGAAKDMLAKDAVVAAKITNQLLANLQAAGCKINNQKFICDTLKEINECETAFIGGYGGTPCVRQTTTAAQVEMIAWHKDKRFQAAGLACSYDILWNTTAVGCSDPDFVKQCNTLLQNTYRNKAVLDIPKAGVMDCQLKRTPEQKKWADAMPQVAQVLSPGFDFNFNINTPTPATKKHLPECKLHSTDPLQVSCPGLPIAPGSPNYKLAEQLLGAGHVRECTAAERSSAEHWVDTPCINWSRVVAVDQDSNKFGTTNEPVKTPGGVAIGTTVGAKLPPKINVAPPTGAFKPPSGMVLSPTVGSGAGAALRPPKINVAPPTGALNPPNGTPLSSSIGAGSGAALQPPKITSNVNNAPPVGLTLRALGAADLAVQPIELKDRGQRKSVYVCITNKGKKASGGFAVSTESAALNPSTNKVNGQYRSVGNQNYPSVAPAGFACNDFVLPAGETGKCRSFKVQVDINATANETNEGNNTDILRTACR